MTVATNEAFAKASSATDMVENWRCKLPIRYEVMKGAIEKSKIALRLHMSRGLEEERGLNNCQRKL